MIKLVHAWSNLFKLDQIGSNWIKKDQRGSSGSNWFKIDQTYSNLIRLTWSDLIRLDQTWSDLIKLVETWSNWIKKDQRSSNGSNWFKIDQVGSNLIEPDQTRLVLLKTLIVNSTLYVESTCVNSFKGSLGYFKAERVKYCPNLPELLSGNIC